MELKVGDVFIWSKIFNEEETLQFAELTGDKGNIIWNGMKKGDNV